MTRAKGASGDQRLRKSASRASPSEAAGAELGAPLRYHGSR